MGNIVQTFRSPTPNRLPSAGARLAGELWVNFPDRQIGFVNDAQNAQPLVAVRYFSTTTAYGAGDFVTQAGGLYVAKSTVPAGPFVPAQWNQLATYTGGTFASLIVNGPAATPRIITGQTNGSNRWGVLVGDAAPESGSNAGSDFAIYRYNDAGAFVDGPLVISRATGVVSFPVKPSIPGYLQLSGGTLTGGLAGTTVALSGTISANGVQSNNAGNFYAIGAAGTPLQYIGMRAAGNSLRWVMALGDQSGESGGNAGSNFLLTGYSDTSQPLGNYLQITRASGQVTCSLDLSVGRTFFGGSTMYPVYASDPNMIIQTQATQKIFQWSPSWYDNWNTSTGARGWIGPSGTLLTLDGNGNLGAIGAINCNGDMFAGAGVYALGARNSFGLYQNGTTERALMFGGNSWFIGWTVATGLLRWVANTGTPAQIFSLDPGGSIVIAGQGYKPGGGVWAAPSDARIKDVQGDYTQGLDAVLRLNPVIYTYKGNDTPTEVLHIEVEPAEGEERAEPHTGPAPYPASPHVKAAETRQSFVGLVAQEVEAVFPDMVTRREGYIDGEKVTDLRDLDTSSLIFALVNAVKTLAARVTELEGASAAR